MDFSKIDFCHKAFVDLHVGAYGSVSSYFFMSKDVRPQISISSMVFMSKRTILLTSGMITMLAMCKSVSLFYKGF